MTKRICNRCVLDSDVPNISFDDHGNCNYCNEFVDLLTNESLHADLLHRSSKLEKLVQQIKDDGAGKPYDCIIGVSGGLDSSWTLFKAVQLGLRPLAVHMDNGWNSELAVNNISNLIDDLEVDLYTYVVEWHEYRNLMQAFFDSDVIDIELLYDNAMTSVCYEQARKYKLKYILSGSNTATEGLRIPTGWSWRDKWDATNIRSIASGAGIKVDSLPTFSNLDWLKYTYLRKIWWVPFLDFLPEYNKASSLKVLETEYSYKPYPYKHYENVFTRFYQGYLLPEKFKVDKRKVHLSTLIVTGQITRAEAIDALEKIAYPSVSDLEKDKEYFLKKMNWTQAALSEYLLRPEKQHDEWSTDPVRRWIWPFFSMMRRVLSK